MATKKDIQTVAAIDVGSNYIRMSIAEIDSEGRINILEELIKPTNIGKDTFTTGRISAETIHDTCDILKKFSQLIRDYRIKDYRAVTTSAMREAENREYILEQFRIKTGITVEIINSAQERFLTYKALRSYAQDYKLINSQSTLIINITSGGVEVSIYDEGSLKFTEYIKLGSLRLRETLSGLETMTIDFPNAMEEYIESKIYLLKAVIKNMHIKNFIGLGGEINRIFSRYKDSRSSETGKVFVDRKIVNELHRKMSSMSDEKIMGTYDVSKKEAEILLPSIILFHSFIKMTEAAGISVPMISLRHGLLVDMADEFYDTKGRKDALNDIISSVWYIAEKYGIYRKHASFVEELALSIFDQTWKLHRLEEKERLYLQVAAILHDAGNYVSFSEHEVHSYSIIKLCNIMGFSNSELNLIANIARYHAYDIPLHSHTNYTTLGSREKVTVSMLSAILKLAESLDVSHSQKIRKIEVDINQDNAVFILHAVKDTLLEEWDFRNNAEFFEEVMGIRPITKHKG